MTKQDIAAKLLLPLFKGIDAKYKSDYAREIWTQFENRVRDSAYTSSLPKFIENMCNRLPIHLDERSVADVLHMLHSNQDDEILNLLRNETVYLVLYTRILNKK